ncbi:MAG TPA: NADH-quinone oxidoreductase subunit K [Pirellulales bacterium]|jgi:multicomponent Na+:H+ antiporter subunit C|nr:NADH-quinone oxidoreductase subunit K [Pirellulales bacterium]
MIAHLPYFVAAWLLVIALYGMATSRNLVHLIGCLGVVQAASYLVLLSVGFRWPPAEAPIYQLDAPDLTMVDPIVQALTLTDVVVSAASAALLLSLTVQIHKRKGTIDPRKLLPLRNR